MTLVSEITSDFPRDEFAALFRRLPSYGRLAWALARDQRLSRFRRAAVLAAAGYVISPIDLVPGIIPVVGQLDDLFVALTAIRLALDGLKPEWRAEKLAAAGLAQTDLDTDMRATGHILGWMGRSGLKVGQRATSGAIHAGRSMAGRVLEAGRRARERNAA